LKVKHGTKMLSTCIIADQIYIFGGNCVDYTTVERYSPLTGGTILSTRIVGDWEMAAVSVGKLPYKII
jgi:hypothetical protein